MISTIQSREHEFCSRFVQGCRAPKIRPMLQFAEQEIIIPSGPFEGLGFRVDRQPFVRHWFDAVDSGRYSEHVITGPSQSGKTLVGFVIPLLYHLFEVGETVIGAVPDFDIVKDKWEQDIEPVLSRTKYRDLLPATGSGSKGGRSSSIKFRNGAILRWMTAGGSDKSRSAFTSRVVCMTETDGFDTRASTSEEATKIKQIEARMRSYHLELRRIYKECTLTTSAGHTWQRYQAGTCSMLMLPCPHCNQYVALERENLHGWQNSESDEQARRDAQFFCSECGAAWTEAERRQANTQCILRHRGQDIVDGQLVGDVPETRTLGFRWSAVNNMLVPAGDVAADEWAAVRSVDEDSAERELCQFIWAIPYVPKDVEDVPLDVDVLKRRTSVTGKGQLPDGTQWVTIGVDVNKPVLHWAAIAWQSDGRGVVIDYGKQGLHSKTIGFEQAIKEGMKRLSEQIGEGWSSSEYHRVHVDVRWSTTEVLAAIRSLGDKRWKPFMGLGLGHWKQRSYTQPTGSYGDVIKNGNMWYERVMQVHRCIFTFADSNYWKTWLHQRLSVDKDVEGSLKLYAAVDESHHLDYVKHITSEREVQKFEPGKGYVKVWESIRSANHWLDATYMACVAGDRCGFRIEGGSKHRPPAVPGAPGLDSAVPSRQTFARQSFSAPNFRR